MHGETNLNGDTIDTSISPQSSINTVFRKEIKGTTNIRNTKTIMVSSEIKKQTLVKSTSLNNTIHHIPIFHPFILILLHR